MTILFKGGQIGSELRSKIDEEVGGGKTVLLEGQGRRVLANDDWRWSKSC